MDSFKVLNWHMSRKVIFICASTLIFVMLDVYWVYPPLFNHLPIIFGWCISFALAGCEIVGLIVEWRYLKA